jgi:uncharacterized repeat protein (TIGR02543 family)
MRYQTAYQSAPLYRDITLYAKWQAQNYNVTFHLQGGNISGSTANPVISVPYGVRAAPPGPPTRSGYVFMGWYTSPTGGDLVDFTAAITQVKTFHAQWRQVFTVTLVNPDTALTIFYTVLAGENITLSRPSMWGESLEGWYPVYSSVYHMFSGAKVGNDTVVAVNADIVYYARLYYRVTFNWSGVLDYNAVMVWADPLKTLARGAGATGISAAGNIQLPPGTYGSCTVQNVVSGTVWTMPQYASGTVYNTVWRPDIGNDLSTKVDTQCLPIRRNTVFTLRLN